MTDQQMVLLRIIDFNTLCESETDSDIRQAFYELIAELESVEIHKDDESSEYLDWCVATDDVLARLDFLSIEMMVVVFNIIVSCLRFNLSLKRMPKTNALFDQMDPYIKSMYKKPYFKWQNITKIFDDYEAHKSNHT